MGAGRRVVTLLIADVVGSTEMLSSLGDETAQPRLDLAMRVVAEAVTIGGGVVVKETGDGVLAFFDGPGAAFDAALAVQTGRSGPSVGVRIGIHAGEVTVRDGDVHGLAVAVADRITHLAGAGDIVVSSVTRAIAGAEPRWRWLDGGTHELRGVGEPVAVVQLVGSSAETTVPARLTSGTARPQPLPRYRTSLVGRDAQVDDLAKTVAPGSLVTLSGVGGVGKTRLAVAVATRAGSAWAGGVAFVDLAGISADSPVGVTALRAVGGREESGRPWQDTLAEFMAGRAMLVVVDNCEHLIDPTRELVELLLNASPSGAVLATSRQPLAVHGEQVWPVPPLDAGGADAAAVELFGERARAANPAFRAEAGDLAALAERLGGLPLAIEMVAPWTRSLSVREIDARLDQLLAAADRSAPERQRTMKATLDWSDRLLGEGARRTFHCLGVFVGGFDLTAADAVAAEVDGGEGAGVLAALAHLVDASLVEALAIEGGTTRYRLLEPVRQYALGRLAESGREAETRDRHLAHYVGLAREAEPHLHLADARDWFGRLDAEQGNLGAALGWALRCAQGDQAVQLASDLWWYWWLRGRGIEGIGWLQRVVNVPTTSDRAIVRVHVGLSALLLQAGKLDEGRAEADRALSAARSAGDPRLEAHALGTLGRLAVDADAFDQAEQFYRASLQLYRRVGSRGGQAWMLLCIAGLVGLDRAELDLADADALDLAERDALDGQTLFVAKADRWGAASCGYVLGWIALMRGEVPEALGWLRQSTDEFRSLDVSDEGAANAQSFYAAALARSGDLAAALDAADEAVSLADSLADPSPQLRVLDALMTIARISDRPDIAERCAAAWVGLHHQLRRPVPIPARMRVPDAHVPGRDTARRLLDDLRATGGARAPAPALLVQPLTYHLRRDGAVWEAGQQGRTFRLPDRKGIRALAHLIAHPGQELHALELTAVVERQPVAVIGDTGAVLDEHAKAAYRQRIRDNQSEIDEAEAANDPGRADKARQELAALTEQLATAVGLGGRDRQTGSTAERARINVTRVVRDAIGRIAAHDADLGHHLSTCVSTGVYCKYEPAPHGAPTWIV